MLSCLLATSHESTNSFDFEMQSRVSANHLHRDSVDQLMMTEVSRCLFGVQHTLVLRRPCPRPSPFAAAVGLPRDLCDSAKGIGYDFSAPSPPPNHRHTHPDSQEALPAPTHRTSGRHMQTFACTAAPSSRAPAINVRQAWQPGNAQAVVCKPPIGGLAAGLPCSTGVSRLETATNRSNLCPGREAAGSLTRVFRLVGTYLPTSLPLHPQRERPRNPPRVLALVRAGRGQTAQHALGSSFFACLAALEVAACQQANRWGAAGRRPIIAAAASRPRAVPSSVQSAVIFFVWVIPSLLGS